MIRSAFGKIIADPPPVNIAVPPLVKICGSASGKYIAVPPPVKYIADPPPVKYITDPPPVKYITDPPPVQILRIRNRQVIQKNGEKK